jgi:hypothetical protein
MILSLLVLAQAQSGPWDGYKQDPIVRSAPERLGPGVHTLVIADGNAITRIDYRSGTACQRARDEIRRQVAPPARHCLCHSWPADHEGILRPQIGTP